MEKTRPPANMSEILAILHTLLLSFYQVIATNIILRPGILAIVDGITPVS